MIAVDIVNLPKGAPGYPSALKQCLAEHAPAVITAVGNLDVLSNRSLALLCSVKCPGDVILQAYDLACSLRDAGVTVVGGFHSPMERECLAVLLRGTQPIVICPARSVENVRLPADLKPALEAGRLLLLSPFPANQRRATADLAQERNEFVAALADHVLIAHASPGGKLEALARRVLGWGKPLFTLESERNAALLNLGARGVNPRGWGETFDRVHWLDWASTDSERINGFGP